MERKFEAILLEKFWHETKMLNLIGILPDVLRVGQVTLEASVSLNVFTCVLVVLAAFKHIWKGRSCHASNTACKVFTTAEVRSLMEFATGRIIIGARV